jgi:hypothetical protein
MTTTTTSTPTAPASNGNTAVPEPQASLRDRVRHNGTAFPSELHTAWGEQFEVRSLTVAKKAQITEAATNDNDDLLLDRLLPAVVVATCHDPVTGQPVFTDEDIEWIKEQPAGIVEPLATVGLRVSGLEKAALEGKSDGS